jgi:hypothetical protein
MQQQSQVLDDRDQALSQAQLDSSTQGKQREGRRRHGRTAARRAGARGGHLQASTTTNKAADGAASRGRDAAALSRLSRGRALAGEPATGEYTLDADRARSCCACRARVAGRRRQREARASPCSSVCGDATAQAAKLRVEDFGAADAIAVSRLVAR